MSSTFNESTLPIMNVRDMKKTKDIRFVFESHGQLHSADMKQVVNLIVEEMNNGGKEGR